MTEKPSMKLELPKIKLQKLPLSGTDFFVSIYEHQNDFFLDGDENLKSEVAEVFKALTKLKLDNFCEQISIKSTPFLVSVFYDTKSIQVHSPRLNMELFWMHNLKGQFETAEIVEFKDSVERTLHLNHAPVPSIIERVTEKYDLNDIFQGADSSVEKREEELRNQILVHLNSYSPSLFEKVSDVGLSLSASYALIRIHLLKFLAMLPSLDYDKSGKEVKRVWLESLRRLLEDNQKAAEAKLKGQMRALPKRWRTIFTLKMIICSIVPAPFLANMIRAAVRKMGRRFIAGENINEANQVFSDLGQTGREVTLDQLGELVVSEKEAENYKDQVLQLIRGFHQHYREGAKNSAGINKAHVSIKVSALCSDFKAEAFEYTQELIRPRLEEILLEAKKHSVYINVDAEHYSHRDTVLRIFANVLKDNKDLHDFDQTGIVLQAYLRDAKVHLDEIAELAKERGLVMPIRLVKGAYWDAETIEAEVHSENAPQFLNKEETDLHFRQIIEAILKDNNLQLVLASHNFSDHCFAEALRDLNYKSAPAIEHQCLHMTYEALSVSLAKMGWAVRNYVPIGSLLVGMAYLVRRIMENSSQVGVLTIMRSHKKVKNLVHPRDVLKDNKEKNLLAKDTTLQLTDDFFNVTPIQYYLEEELNPFLKTLEEFELNKDYANSFQTNGEDVSVVSGSATDKVVGKIKFATVEDARTALGIVHQAHVNHDWENFGVKGRAATFVKAANLMLLRRKELSALIMYEAGKTLKEAFGDVDEAIDFLNFYARHAVDCLADFPKKVPLGPHVVISPWNFPLAIPTGMVSAPLVMGNPVILKSAEQTPLIAQVMVDLFHEAGVPKDVLIHVPGEGETVGDAIVNDERIAAVVFTGSKAVGTLIAENCSKRVYCNPVNKAHYPVRVITEMGGKNAVVVTASAELDETVSGILYSSFAHAGQKCSAASRIIVDERVKPRLVERLKEACLDIKVGSALELSTTVNPVITKEDQERLVRQADEASDEARKKGGKTVVNRTKWEENDALCVGPALFELPYKSAFDKTSYAQRELFGPVVHVIGYRTHNEAIELFNSTDYALTGGIFAQSQDDIDAILPHLKSGNLYLNRSITGARVAIEPFGGFKMSGTGPKAGHKVYLNAFRMTLFDETVVGERKIVEEDGASYDLDLCRASKLRFEERYTRVLSLMKDFEKNFEHYYYGIYGDQKRSFKKFVNYFETQYVPFVTGQWKNRVTAGQDNYNDLYLTQDKVLLVSYEWRPYFSTLLTFFSCLMNGTGITVITRHKDSYAWWSNLLALANRNGLSKENFDVYFVTSGILDGILKRREFETVVFDARHDRIEGLQKEVFHQDRNEWENMVKVLFPHNSYHDTDYRSMVLATINMRAVANNTMRHGAPLELEF
jgi:RHH-type proline utilization regulon transcriptional repressor/proline dehydrogenase/delta 1-pyrroline-5-carboxylate dehydrogenase